MQYCTWNNSLLDINFIGVHIFGDNSYQLMPLLYSYVFEPLNIIGSEVDNMTNGKLPNTDLTE